MFVWWRWTKTNTTPTLPNKFRYRDQRRMRVTNINDIQYFLIPAAAVEARRQNRRFVFLGSFIIIYLQWQRRSRLRRALIASVHQYPQSFTDFVDTSNSDPFSKRENFVLMFSSLTSHRKCILIKWTSRSKLSEGIEGCMHICFAGSKEDTKRRRCSTNVRRSAFCEERAAAANEQVMRAFSNIVSNEAKAV